ncbi:ketosteroid isomerase-like protein [Inhella inkyongensis]|uniref:Ketosteroid isomerase-like protein n=1 Tax=Inhella inkyongensis TaxID=392593 RepID=A0A840S9M4_9BURK|nr:nuclear transport factor 2 family protein [Inhella inkyongensis]MBB5205109.1 ketosteroid isomerase-like protein [Inhella inkyongensis]
MMVLQRHKQALMAYLKAYAAKNLGAIEMMFAEDISLCDWNLAVQGKAAALAETQKNFDAVRELQIEVLAVHESAEAVAAELLIRVDRQHELRVVDVLGFDDQGLIRSIRAYKGL